MQAIVYAKYGPPDVMQIVQVDKPTPKDKQVLIEVHASSANASDYRVRTGKPLVMRLFFGSPTRPKNTRPGSDVAGRVVAVGEYVSQFQPGDEVFGCADGAFAGYVLAREANVTLKPARITFEAAAATPVAALTALQGFRYAGGIRPGQKVLIQGASGGVGTFAVQIAKSFGAEVSAVCRTSKMEMARSIGADYEIDYTQEDFTHRGFTYDLIFAVNGFHSLADYKRALSPGGIYVCAGGTMTQIFQAMLLGKLYSRGSDKKLGSMGIANVNQADLVTLAELLETGKIVPVIDRSYPLSEIVAAFNYVETGHPAGKVVITVDVTNR